MDSKGPLKSVYRQYSTAMPESLSALLPFTYLLKVVILTFCRMILFFSCNRVFQSSLYAPGVYREKSLINIIKTVIILGQTAVHTHPHLPCLRLHGISL